MSERTLAQIEAVAEARRFIAEDGDSTGPVRERADCTLRIAQIAEDGDVVREWIVQPDGRLTWRS